MLSGASLGLFDTRSQELHAGTLSFVGRQAQEAWKFIAGRLVRFSRIDTGAVAEGGLQYGTGAVMEGNAIASQPHAFDQNSMVEIWPGFHVHSVSGVVSRRSLEKAKDKMAAIHGHASGSHLNRREKE